MTLPGMLTGDGTVLVQRVFVIVSINTSKSHEVRISNHKVFISNHNICSHDPKGRHCLLSFLTSLQVFTLIAHFHRHECSFLESVFKVNTKHSCLPFAQEYSDLTGQWSGLKHLPTASNKDFANSSQTDIIKQKRSKLDKALANLPEPEVVTASEVAAAAEQVSETQPTADQFASQAGVDDEKDEDLVRDLNRVRSQKQPSPGQQEPSSQSMHLYSV